VAVVLAGFEAEVVLLLASLIGIGTAVALEASDRPRDVAAAVADWPVAVSSDVVGLAAIDFGTSCACIDSALFDFRRTRGSLVATGDDG